MWGYLDDGQGWTAPPERSTTVVLTTTKTSNEPKELRKRPRRAQNGRSSKFWTLRDAERDASRGDWVLRDGMEVMYAYLTN